MKIVRVLDGSGATRHAEQNPDGTLHAIDGDIFGSFSVSTETVSPGTLLAPVTPPNVYCIGLNYRRHAAEGGVPIPERPVVFLKATTSVQNPGDPIVLPRHARSDEVDYEGELVVVIGRACSNVSAEQALDYVFGYTCGNDVSARDWQLRYGGGQWSRGKNFDTFAPLGPCLVTTDEIPDPSRLSLRTVLNGDVMQECPTGDMVFAVPDLIGFLSEDTTLLPGTVIMTGTPHGVGMARTPPVFLTSGDTVSVEIDGIGVLSNPVVEVGEHTE